MGKSKLDAYPDGARSVLGSGEQKQSSPARYFYFHFSYFLFLSLSG
jgi:hypothetical protein